VIVVVGGAVVDVGGVVNVSVVLIDDVAATATAAPVAVPRVPAPGEATADKAAATKPYANRHGRAKGNDRSCNDDARAVERHDIGRAVDNRRIVLRDIDNVRICRLNDDRLRRLLDYLNLRRGLQSSRSLCLGAHHLHRSHYVSLLVLKCLAEIGCPT
jgi:hypothetical protein